MKHHDIKSLPAEQLCAIPETAVSKQEEFAALAAKLRAQRQRFQQFNEFCDRAIAEIRASLEGSQNEANQDATEQKKPAGRRRFFARPKSARAA